MLLNLLTISIFQYFNIATLVIPTLDQGMNDFLRTGICIFDILNKNLHTLLNKSVLLVSLYLITVLNLILAELSDLLQKRLTDS